MKNKPKRYVLNDLFLACMCKRFVDIPGTKILILNGKELFSRIRRRLKDYDVPLICDFLSRSPNVVSLNLAYNSITDKGMTNLVNFLKENESLLELNIMNNDISEDGIIELSGLKNSINLKSLRINGNKIGAKGLKALALTVSTNESLTQLDVGETDLNMEALVYFMTVLRTNTVLESIDLSRVLGPPGHVLQTDHVADVIQQMLALNHTLKELYLQKIGFIDHDIELLVEGLKRNSSLLLLDLSCNRIADFGVECLAELLGTKPPLLTLFISHNQITDQGARALSFKFPHSNIVHMDISHNKMTQEGLLHILNCLKKKRPVKTLFLRGNQIEEKVSKVLFRMLVSGVLTDCALDVNVYKDSDQYKYKCNEATDHLRPHYYCLCATTEHKHCRKSTVFNIRNKKPFPG